jgi:MFS family permease
MSHRGAIALVFAVHGAVFGGIATRMPWIQDHLGLSPRELGLALFFAPIGAVAAMPTAGRLAHRFGNRATIRMALALCCVALGVLALAPNLAGLCVAFLFGGAAAGMCDVVMNAQGVLIERGLGRSIMSGLHGMWSVGGLTGALVGVAAAQAGVDARLHFAGWALALLAVGHAAVRALPDTRPAPDEQAPPRFALPTRQVLPIGLLGFCSIFAEGAGNDWAAVYIKEVTGAGHGLAAAGFAVFALCMASARLAGDHVVRRFGAVRTVRGGAVLATLGGLLVVSARTPAPGMIGFALIGLGVAVTVPLVFAAGGNAGPTPSQGVAGVATITYLSGLAAPAVIGWVADATSYPFAFGVVTCLVAMMGLLAGTLRAHTPARDSAAVA